MKKSLFAILALCCASAFAAASVPAPTDPHPAITYAQAHAAPTAEAVAPTAPAVIGTEATDLTYTAPAVSTLARAVLADAVRSAPRTCATACAPTDAPPSTAADRASRLDHYDKHGT